MRARAAVLAPVAGLALAVLLALAAVPAEALEGVAYLPPAVQLRSTLEKPVLTSYYVEAPAGTDSNADGVIDTPGVATVDLSQYLPTGFAIEAVKVVVEGASGTATLKALDSGGAVLATVDVVPLSSGYEVTLPAGTTQLQIENLAASVWSGYITVIVLSSIDVELQFGQSQVQITGGQALVPATIIIRQLPADGVFSLQDNRADFTVEFTDPADADADGKTADDRYIYARAHSDPNNPVQLSVNVKITTSAPPGTYNVKVTMYFHEGTRLEAPAPGQTGLEVGSFSMTVTLQGDTGTAEVTETPAEEEGGFNWVAFGIGAIVLVAALFLLSSRK